MAEPADDWAREAGGVASRRSLLGLAYRLLGSVEDAEDVVQDAHVKMLAVERNPDDARSYLFRTVTNLAIDRLRHLKVQRRSYPGPWLPEPLLTDTGSVEGEAAVADDLSVAFLLLLERLSVSERVAFVLREALDLSFDEMSAVLGVRSDACRQRYRRARRKLADVRRAPPQPALQRQALERLVEAVGAGDAHRLAALLTDDALLLTDGGGRVSAAVNPVEKPERIARVLVHLAAREDHRGTTLQFIEVNGGIGALLTVADESGQSRPYACVQADVEGDRVSRIYVVRNPAKLARLPTVGAISRSRF